MIKTALLAGVLLAGSNAAAGEPIASVIVYGDRAQVTRTTSVECAAGKATFAGLPSTLQPETLWASVRGGGKVAGLTHTEVASGPRPEAAAVQDKIRAVDTELVKASQEAAAAAAAVRKLKGYLDHVGRVWGEQAAGKKPDLKGWDAGLGLLRQRALSAGRRNRAATSRTRDLHRQRALLIGEVAAMERKRRRTTITAEVLLEKCSGRRTVALVYTVPGASWDMRYQLRAEAGGKKVTVVAQAAVRQGTGEDWRGVKLALSTANLARQNDPPTVRPMWVTSHEPPDSKKVLTRRFEQRKHLKTGGRPGSSRGKAAAAGPSDDLAMSIPADGKASIPADGREVLVTLARRTIKASTGAETVPKLFPFVYTRVTAVNPFAFTMLPGPAELFSGRSSLGRTRLKLHAPGEPLSFTLGVHNQLQVKRYVKKEKLEGPGAFGSEKKLRHRYVIDLGNWTRQARTIRVLENLPISRAKDVKVTLGDEATKPTRWNKEDGLLTWDIKVPARSKKKLVLDFTVKLPKKWEVRGYN